VFVEFRVGSGPCDRLITRSEESYWVFVCVSDFVWPKHLNDEAT